MGPNITINISVGSDGQVAVDQGEATPPMSLGELDAMRADIGPVAAAPMPIDQLDALSQVSAPGLGGQEPISLDELEALAVSDVADMPASPEELAKMSSPSRKTRGKSATKKKKG